MSVQRRANGDLILFWPNGDPAVKLQADGPFISLAHRHAHPLDSVTMALGPDVIEELRDWCEQRLAERGSGA